MIQDGQTSRHSPEISLSGRQDLPFLSYNSSIVQLVVERIQLQLISPQIESKMSQRLWNWFIWKAYIECPCKPFYSNKLNSSNYSSYFDYEEVFIITTKRHGLFQNFPNIFVENPEKDATFHVCLHIINGS